MLSELVVSELVVLSELVLLSDLVACELMVDPIGASPAASTAISLPAVSHNRPRSALRHLASHRGFRSGLRALGEQPHRHVGPHLEGFLSRLLQPVPRRFEVGDRSGLDHRYKSEHDER